MKIKPRDSNARCLQAVVDHPERRGCRVAYTRESVSGEGARLTENKGEASFLGIDSRDGVWCEIGADVSLVNKLYRGAGHSGWLARDFGVRLIVVFGIRVDEAVASRKAK